MPVHGFESRKALALLCFLAVQDQPVSRSQLVGLFWGDKPEDRARGNLSRVLNNLSTLLPGCLQTDRHTIQFRRSAAFWLDLIAFDERITQGDAVSLAAALKLYRGEFMADFYLDDCPEFETWLLVERERWHQRVAQILQKLIAHHTQQGEYEPGLGFASRLLELDPWREEAHQQMMRLLAYSGQRSAALAQYETCCRVLAEELGVDPSEETTALYERIRDGDWSRGETFASHPLPPSAPAPFLSSAPLYPHPAPPFVARERELAQLDDFLSLTLLGQGRVAFVTGEAGTGKTALVQAFAERAHKRQTDLIVANGTCHAYTGVGDPYLPFREILGLLTGDVEAKWAAGVISREHAQRLWTLMPHVFVKINGRH